MSKRSKDKRTKETLKKFHDMINKFILYERLAYIKIDGNKTEYIISSHGIVYSLKNKDNINIIRPFIDKDGHIRVSLSYNGRVYKKFVHRLVAEAFLENIENKDIVHHKNGDTLNNDVENLMWVTKEEHDFLTSELNQYVGIRGSKNSSATCTDEQIEYAVQLIEENKLYPDEICELTGITYSIFQHLRYDKNSWIDIKSKYDISKYDKFRRLKYTFEQKTEFVKIRRKYPDYTLKKISKILNIKYETIKSWNIRYKNEIENLV